MWTRFWRRSEGKDEWNEFTPSSEDPELREIFVRAGLRVAAAFALLFGFVSFAFWWSGSAVGFGARRAAGQAQPTWHISGTVRSASSHEPVPWAVVEDDPNGRPPLYHTDASYLGAFDLLTLAEPHHLRVSAPGYESATVAVGRSWFLWVPKGVERHDVYLSPK
jgi:hypothetical protein